MAGSCTDMSLSFVLFLVPADGGSNPFSIKNMGSIAEFLPRSTDVHVTRSTQETQPGPVDRGRLVDEEPDQVANLTAQPGHEIAQHLVRRRTVQLLGQVVHQLADGRP